MTKPRLEGVVALLRTWMREDGWPESGLLPPTRGLARDLGCALQTLHVALKELQTLGLIRKTPSGGRWQVSASAPHPVQDPLRERRRHRFRTLAEELERELLAGRYGSNQPLPSVGQLQARFGCSWRTAKRAQEELIESGLARRRGRALWPRLPESSPRAHSSPCSEIWVTGQASLERSAAPWLMSQLLALERLAADVGGSGGIRIRYRYSARPMEELPAPGAEVIGILHFKSDFVAWRDWFLRHRTTPLAILDAGERMRPVAVLSRRRPGTLGISSDNYAAGRELAQALARSGHRRVALLSPVPLERGWPMLRWQGLQTIFPAAADSDGRMSVERIAGGDPGQPSTLLPTTLPTALRQMLSRYMSDMPMVERLYGALCPAFTQWSERADITAWVGLTDLAAALAAGYLKAHPPRSGVKPQLAGFDASPLSRAFGFASYDFDLEAHMHLAFRFLVEPHSVPHDRRHLTRVRGRLLWRDT